MANKFRGEADLSFTQMDDDDKEVPVKLKLVLDTNAFCEIEDQTGLGMGGFLTAMSDISSLSFKNVRAFLLGALTTHHPEFDLKRAGDVISDAGLDLVIKTLNEAVGKAMPKKAGKGGAKGEAKSGTGTKP